MNDVVISGYLPADAVVRTTPNGQQKLTCEIISQDGRVAPVEVKCEIERPDLVQNMEPLLVRGRAVLVRGELAMRPVREAGVLRYMARFVRVLEIEVPNRGKMPEEGTSHE